MQDAAPDAVDDAAAASRTDGRIVPMVDRTGHSDQGEAQEEGAGGGTEQSGEGESAGRAAVDGSVGVTISGHEPFGLATWMLWTLALLYGVQVAFPVSRTFDSGVSRWAFTIGFLVMSVLVTIGPAWLTWRFGGRSRRRATIACFVGVLVAGSVVVVSRQRAAEEERAWEEFQREMTAVQAEMQAAPARNMESGEVPSDSSAGLQAMADAYRKVSLRISGPTARLLGACGKVLDETAFRMRARNAAVKQFVDGGGTNPGTLPTREAIDARIALLDAGRGATDALLGSIRTMEPRLRDELRRIGAARRVTDAAAQEIANGLAAFDVEGIQQGESDVSEVMREQLVLLRDTWPGWRYIPADNVVEFDDGSALQRFQDQSRRLDEALARFEETRRQLLRLQTGSR